MIRDAKAFRKIVDKLLAIEYPAQRSKEWFDMRNSCVSASDSGCVLGDNQHEPQYMMYLKKLTSRPHDPSRACYHGTKLEKVATMIYEFRNNTIVEEFGLVKHPTISFLGASPDGICGKYCLDGKTLSDRVGTMLEIKCPISRKINDDDPFEDIIYYERQVQQQLEVCDLDVCDFWQCQIEEYKTRADFIADTDKKCEYKSKETGNEKGCLIQLLKKSEMVNSLEDKTMWEHSKFIYLPKIDMTLKEQDEWTLNIAMDVEKYLINETYEKHQKAMSKITKLIDFEEFEKFYREELEEKANNTIKWMRENNIPVKAQTFENQVKKKLDLMKEEFKNNIYKKLSDKKFLKYTFTFIDDFDDGMVNDDIFENIINVDKNKKFYDETNKNKNLKLIANLIRDLEVAKGYSFHRIFYWRLVKSLCTPVHRRKEWFAERLPIYERIWNNITKLRANPAKAKEVLDHIENMPTHETHFGKEYKKNEDVIKYINFICDEIK